MHEKRIDYKRCGKKESEKWFCVHSHIVRVCCLMRKKDLYLIWVKCYLLSTHLSVSLRVLLHLIFSFSLFLLVVVAPAFSKSFSVLKYFIFIYFVMHVHLTIFRLCLIVVEKTCISGYWANLYSEKSAAWYWGLCGFIDSLYFYHFYLNLIFQFALKSGIFFCFFPTFQTYCSFAFNKHNNGKRSKLNNLALFIASSILLSYSIYV